MPNPFTKFICTVCGHRDTPCRHFNEEENRKWKKLVQAELLEILHLLNILTTPHYATLTLTPEGLKENINVPATIQVGKTASSNFQEWTGPNGTGTVIPNAGPIAFVSDNEAVATVDPATGKATGVAPGTCNIIGTDQVNNLTAGDSLTVVAPPPVAVSATNTLTAD